MPSIFMKKSYKRNQLPRIGFILMDFHSFGEVIVLQDINRKTDRKHNHMRYILKNYRIGRNGVEKGLNQTRQARQDKVGQGPDRGTPAGPTLAPARVWGPLSASGLLCRFSTALGFSSTPSIKVSLIRGLRCILQGYISRARPPRPEQCNSILRRASIPIQKT